MTYEEKLKEEFYKNFNANTIWVVPSEGNKETIDEVWSFISQSLSNYKKELVEEIRHQIVGFFPMGKMMYEHKTAEEVLEIIFRYLSSLLQKDKENK